METEGEVGDSVRRRRVGNLHCVSICGRHLSYGSFTPCLYDHGSTHVVDWYLLGIQFVADTVPSTNEECTACLQGSYSSPVTGAQDMQPFVHTYHTAT